MPQRPFVRRGSHSSTTRTLCTTWHGQRSQLRSKRFERRVWPPSLRKGHCLPKPYARFDHGSAWRSSQNLHLHPSSSMPTTTTACPFSRTPSISSSSRAPSNGRSRACSPTQSAAWRTTAASSSMSYSECFGSGAPRSSTSGSCAKTMETTGSSGRRRSWALLRKPTCSWSTRGGRRLIGTVQRACMPCWLPSTTSPTPSVTARRTCTEGVDTIGCCRSRLRWAA